MAEYLPYLPSEGGGWKRRFEITIPILLLILVFIVIAWKVGWLAQVPILGDMFKSKVVNVLVVGQDANVERILDEMKSEISINRDTVTSADIKNIISADYLSKYQLIILTESVGPTKGDLSGQFSGYIAKYVNNGGKLILFGIAGSRDPVETGVDNWEASFGSIVPVRCVSPNKPCTESGSLITYPASSLTLKLKDINHAIFRGFGTSANFTGGDIEMALVNPANTEIAVLDVANVGSYAAVIENNAGISGKVLYFAYQPSLTPMVFKNSVKYLVGA
jgi:hypothetical protein